MALAEFESTREELEPDPWGGSCLLDREVDLSWDDDDDHASDWSDEVRESVARMARDSTSENDAADRGAEHPGQPEPTEPSGSLSAQPLAEQFQQLAEVWRAETTGAPFLVTRVTHWAYQRIIGMGPAALPLIFAELSRQTGHWFWALNAITGEDPAEGITNFADAAARWLAWARSNGLLPRSDPGDV